MTFFYRLSICYDGTSFYGWQKQAGKLPTIQFELEKALNRISKNEYIKTVASGRTDAKVHAREQVVRVEFPFFINARSLQKALNSYLPSTIVVNSCEECSKDFHPIFSAISKEYRYYFTLNSLPNPWMVNYISSFFGDFNIDKMHEVSKCFIGEYDFKNFYTQGTPVSSTIRTIFECRLASCGKNNCFPFQSSNEFDLFEFTIIGSGFMKQMVRLIMGSLLNIGLSKVSDLDLMEALNGKLNNKKKLGVVVPPNGLYLYKVNY